MSLSAEKDMLMMVSQEGFIGCETTRKRNRNVFESAQDLFGRLVGSGSPDLRGELDSEIQSDRQQTAVKSPVVDGIQAKPVPRVRSVFHVDRPRHYMARVQQLWNRKPGD